MILDGTLIHTDRVKADRLYFSGKHRVHGMNVQVIAGPDGTHPVDVGGSAGLHCRRPNRRSALGLVARQRPDEGGGVAMARLGADQGAGT